MKFFANLLRFLLLIGLVAYLGYTFVSIGKRGSEEKCTEVHIVIVDSLNAGFINRGVIEKKLTRAHLFPVGQVLDSVSTLKIEGLLRQDPFVREATCYKSPGGNVNIIIQQRMPILRVMADNGDDYYLDEKGYKMLPSGYEADLVVATGNIDDAFARKHLIPLGLYISGDEFWNDQLEQIHITPNKEVLLYTRIGDHTIRMGAPTDIKKKLHNLRLFYDKVIPEVGWSRYKEICIAYNNQVVCKK